MIDEMCGQFELTKNAAEIGQLRMIRALGSVSRLKHGEQSHDSHHG